jgi:hypothetical protein
MSHFHLSNHQAQTAVWLAYRLRGAPSDTITRTLAATGCPRSLYVLAAVLLAATTKGI